MKKLVIIGLTILLLAPAVSAGVATKRGFSLQKNKQASDVTVVRKSRNRQRATSHQLI